MVAAHASTKKMRLKEEVAGTEARASKPTSAYEMALLGIVLLDAMHKHGFLHLAIEELDPQDIQEFVFNDHVRAQVLEQCLGNDVTCATKKFNRQQRAALDFFTRVRSYASR